ncbi:MAG TPA: peptide deformylase [Thermoanaerobaculia bacterium]|nr:peptide deformylase [Thermoanaerobaculia bacterium]
MLGDDRLRARSAEIEYFDDPPLARGLDVLAATLEDFRRRHGFGRAIAAPQIGLPIRAIAVNLGRGTFFVINPVVTWRSLDTFTMWDDCMSFPDRLVRLRRHESVSLEYADREGKPNDWRELTRPESELLQHEIDHLDGILAVDRALGSESIVRRDRFVAQHEQYAALVDYTIY